MSTVSVTNIKHASSSNTNLVMTSGGNVTAAGTVAMGSSYLRNRIINGAMVIDQRNAGAAVTASGSFPVDRWKIQNTSDGAFSSSQSTTAPAGFTNSLYVTTTTADASLTTTQQLVVQQNIEGFNTSDFSFGSASAKTVTLSFWVRSSLTGTFGGSLKNSAGDRSYPFTYSISAANTWEQKSVTAAGDTTGTWLTDNGTGLTVTFGLGVGPDRSGTAGSWAAANYNSATSAVSVIGTLNATWYITGVQLEVGTVATPFERRLYGTELALCQRYLYRLTPTSVASNPFFATAALYNSSTTFANGQFPQQMRTIPTLTLEGAASNYSFFQMGTASYLAATAISLNSVTTNSFFLLQGSIASGGTTGQISYLTGNGQNTYGIQFSAEL